MTRRTKIIIVVVIALLVAILLALLLLRRQQPAAPVVETSAPKAANPVTGLQGSESTSIPVEAPKPVETAPTPAAPAAPKPTDDTSALKRLAAAFAERLGSYSNQSTFDNIRDLKVFMTDSMSAWADSYIAKQLAQGTSTVFSGTTTRAIASNVMALDKDKGTATVVVGTQRNEVSGSSPVPKVYYQDLELKFVKIADQWKVNSAYWK